MGVEALAVDAVLVGGALGGAVVGRAGRGDDGVGAGAAVLSLEEKRIEVSLVQRLIEFIG